VPCTVKTAQVARQVLITEKGFDPACVKVATGKQFFFVNDGKDPRTATSAADSPETFDVNLPKQRFAYEHTFTKKGTYIVHDKRGKTSCTLIVF